MRIYLAALGHNWLTKSSDVYPLGVANLATSATAYVTTGGPPDLIRCGRSRRIGAAS